MVIYIDSYNWTPFCLAKLMKQEFMAFSFKVIPAMALTVGCLGEKLRAISNDANLSAASLAAYLNEVS